MTRRFSFNNKIAEIFRATEHTRRMKNERHWDERGERGGGLLLAENTMGKICHASQHIFRFIYGFKMNSERNRRLTREERYKRNAREQFAARGGSS